MARRLVRNFMPPIRSDAGGRSLSQNSQFGRSPKAIVNELMPGGQAALGLRSLSFTTGLNTQR